MNWAEKPGDAAKSVRTNPVRVSPDGCPSGESHLTMPLRSLYRAHWQELCRYVQHTFGPGPPEPEDVVQIAFARYAALEKPERVQNARAFLYATARNIVLDQKRGQQCIDRYVQDVLSRAGEEIVNELSPERVVMERQRFEILNAAIKRLPDKQRRVVAMSRYHGMTYQQIASKTGWSLADISRQVSRAIATLDAALKGSEAP